MKTLAVVMEQPRQLVLSNVDLCAPGPQDVVVDIDWSGISSGTERLLWSGDMPQFPGMGYPLVPGYESVGHVVDAGTDAGRSVGDCVFVPGARCFGDLKGLFGGAAARLVVPGERAYPIDRHMGERGVLLALAATARHALALPGAHTPDLIVGHGVLGRILARLATLQSAKPPVVWETHPARTGGAKGYTVVDPANDTRTDYRAIYDASGDASLLDVLVKRLAPGGQIVLAGFYSKPLSFSYAPAFMREACIRVAAEWKRPDLAAVDALVKSGQLSLDGLITHRQSAADAPNAYRTAFSDPSCLKMILEWRTAT